MSCCSSEGTCSTTATAPVAVTTVFTVAGMSCGHCERVVGAAVGALVGVRGVRVDVAGGVVSVDWDGEPDEAAVGAAIDEAGYELTGRV